MLPILLALSLGALAIGLALTFVDFTRYQHRPRPLIDCDQAQELRAHYGRASLGIHQTAAQLSEQLGIIPEE